MATPRKGKKGGALSGGDPLTWLLLLGVGGAATYYGLQEYRERNEKVSAVPVPGATPAAPVVSTGGGSIVAPGAPVVVAPGTQAGAAPAAGALTVQLVTVTPTGATVRALQAAQLRLTGVMMVALPGAGQFSLTAGQTQTFDLPAGAVLENLNTAGVWVPVASYSSPNTVAQPAPLPGRPLLQPQPIPLPSLQPVTPPSLLPWVRPQPIWQHGGMMPLDPRIKMSVEHPLPFSEPRTGLLEQARLQILHGAEL